MTTWSPPLASALLQHYSCSCPKLPRNGFPAHIPSLLHFSTPSTSPSLHHSSLLLVRTSSEPEFGVVEIPSVQEEEPAPMLLKDEVDVEEEVDEFMMQSDNPELFPTKEELLAAGREDLVDAMSGQGGWLVLGWDIDDDEEIHGGGAPAAEEAPTSSDSGGLEAESSGVEGLLSRLQKQRRLAFGVGIIEEEKSRNNLSTNTNVESFLEELDHLSDTWEFQQTKIMKIRDKLRSIRVKLSVLEGKMAVGMIEAKKPVEEEQKLPSEAKKESGRLRTVYMSWAYPATQVLLVGSFDGWTTRRNMERTSSGSFTMYLKLYPGRYEIKFIVDGVWKVDPLQPITHSNGFVNNLLVVP